MGIGEAQHIWDQYVGQSHPLDWVTNGQPDEAQIQRHVEWAKKQGWVGEEIEANELAQAMRTCIQYDLDFD